MSNKDSYWFRHDSTAGRGLKLRYIVHIYGHAGKGFYWDVIEVLREQENYSYKSDDTSLQILASIIGVKDEKTFLNWFKSCLNEGLFISEKEVFFSPILTENMKFWDKQKRNGFKGGRPKKTQTKPKRNPNETQKEFGGNHNSTGYNITEEYREFLRYLNQKTGKKYRGDATSRKSFAARIKGGRTIDDFKTAIDNAIADSYHKSEGYKYITAEFLCREDKLDIFFNRTPSEPKQETLKLSSKF